MSKSNVELHKEICAELNLIYEKKNHDYGDSFHKTFEEEGFAMPRIRLTDKLERFKKLSKGDLPQVDESLEDTLLDLANYAIMTVMEIRRTFPYYRENGKISAEVAVNEAEKNNEREFSPGGQFYTTKARPFC